ncbi:MAG: flagellar hook protein FlgE [Proteobacteria bacterium]|uniref:flagellar hook protein FlgE n=1 Tax=Piscinibacter sp. TaxID=1903157 RepID=UPI001B40B361|nr:flagellar hook protein FlgE [Piscinibacter sp.]MBP5988657.1 flagellar hook protein FlgE [Piscinibacter sp.]MBP6025854.1 flagellar hook protein FlgE [Piscinibacter sp.]MBS0443730.1 flagellar hook protein FlgE [Pseudomonadota bacterium]
MSFQQGLSGLNATSKNLEVIGNNVANASTYGFKSARAEFADMYATSMNGTGTNNIGIGVNLASVSQQFTQGNIVTTENPMDLSLNGAGFFQVTDGKSPITYTRNGQFKVDRDGFVVNNQGDKLMGYPADGNGIIQPGTAGPLRMPTAGINPAATSTITMEMNLDSRARSTLPAAGAQIVLSDPSTYNNATSLTVYDDKGQDVALTYYFQKSATDTWNVYVTANGAPISTDASGNPLPSTTINFPANGGTPTAPVGPVTLNIPASTNANGAQTLAINGVQLDLAGATQYGSNFGVTDLSQNGYAPGQLVGIQFEANGIVTARYSNGQSKPAGQVEIATFRNNQGLQPMGGNGWQRSFASGDPVVGIPGDGNLGSIQSGSLEESNVDLTGELVNMITAQRVYQANAQTIKTQDQVLQTLVNLR